MRGEVAASSHDIDKQPSQQQSPDDIPEAEEITDKLAEIEDMEELDARSINNITSLFATLQMCHENSAKLCLTPQETKEEIGINQYLPRPFHPVLAVLPPKHPTRCIVVIIHTVLRRELFNTKESTSTISEQFQVTPQEII